MKIKVLTADYENPRHGSDLIALLDSYAKDPAGGATALTDDVKENLLESLSRIPHAFSIICYVDNQPAGLINCFQTFSTFKCKPLINIHDVVVADNYRGRGISQLMLAEVERIARAKGCCKLTLEVLPGNEAAQGSYRKFGFNGYELDPRMGKALFWEKELGD